jgi:hypothetical protein
VVGEVCGKAQERIQQKGNCKSGESPNINCPKEKIKKLMETMKHTPWDGWGKCDYENEKETNFLPMTKLGVAQTQERP